MAEGTSVRQDDVVCRYFLNSSCRDGESCLFSHDNTRNTPDNVCRYYLQGVCVFGQNCRYDHIRVNGATFPRTNETVRRHPRCNTCFVDRNKMTYHQPLLFNLARRPVRNESSNANRPGSASTNNSVSTNSSVSTNGPISASDPGSAIDPDSAFRSGPASEISPAVASVPISEIGPASTSGPSATGPTSASGPASAIISASASANWVNAPEFVPKNVRSYADTVKANTVINKEPERSPSEELCPYFAEGHCPFQICDLIHGNKCDICQKNFLHPTNEEARKAHIDKCEKEFEQEMEFSFAMQRSMGKTCGICFDVVLEKEPITERRFGILEKCNHVYCLTCIRKWRRSRQFESNQQIDNALDPVVTRACPECRIASDFITPSVYFVDNPEEKQKLISDYKKNLSKKPCKYFKQGEGICPFGGACFYLHAKPDGTKVDLPLPTRRRRQNQDGELDVMGRIFLWDYLEYREENVLINVDLADLMFSWSDTDDDASDISDSFFLSESF